MQQLDGNKSALVEAVKNKDIQMVIENLVLCIDNVDRKSEVFFGLAAACKSGDMELVKIFMNSGYTNEEAGKSACYSGNLEIVKLFYPGKLSFLDGIYNTLLGKTLLSEKLQYVSYGYALCCAAGGGHPHVVNFLFKNYGGTDEKDHQHVLNAIGIALLEGQKKDKTQKIKGYIDVILALLNMAHKHGWVEDKISLIKKLAEQNKCVEFGKVVIERIFQKKVWQYYNSFWMSREKLGLPHDLMKTIVQTAIKLEEKELMQFCRK